MTIQDYNELVIGQVISLNGQRFCFWSYDYVVIEHLQYLKKLKRVYNDMETFITPNNCHRFYL